MKFWQKICLFSIVVFVIIFNGASILVIERNHSKMLQQEINSALSENMSIQSSVDAIIPVLSIYDSLDYEKTVLSSIAKQFMSKNIGDQQIYLHIYNDKRGQIYSNLDFPMPSERQELEGLTAEQIQYILRDIGDRTLLFTANRMNINKEQYVFTYIKDVTHLYVERMDQYRFFVQVDIAACLLYIVAMYLISRGLTKPIDKMVQTAKVIAAGQFSERVQLQSKDEIGVLARNFNHMAAVVEDKINELELNNVEKQRFINNITHELKTPLTSIIGYSNYMRVTKYDEETFMEGLQVIYSEGKRLESLATKLMDLILLKQDQFALVKCNLAAIIESIEPSLAVKIKEKQLLLDVKCSPCSLLLEEDLIKIMIFNLIDNAIKASYEQGRISIHGYETELHYALEIRDEGFGIAPEHLEKLFEPFYVADKARTRKHNGAGLGLAICQSIAAIHQGIIEIHSVEQQGTTVSITFYKPTDQNINEVTR